jgi:hypothetical protein
MERKVKKGKSENRLKGKCEKGKGKSRREKEG